MADRHLSGPATLIDLLNGLEHSLSTSYALEYGTALANAQLERDTLTPDGLTKSRFTTFVLDNSDLKETLSGTGTTHCTSAIITRGKHQQAENEKDSI